METITLFEHDCTSGVDCGRAELQALDELQQRLGVEMLRIGVRRGRCELKASQHVGLLRVGRLTIQVLPKIYRDDPDPRRCVRRASRNLLALLEGAGQVPVYQPGSAPLWHRRQDWFELLTNLFAVQLRQAWQRGPWRGYQAVEEEGTTLRGRWRLAEQMRRPGREHVLAMTYDQFTTDSPVHRLLRYVVERLWLRTCDPKNRRLLNDLRRLFEEVTLLTQIEPEWFDQVTLPPWQEDLRPLLNLARLFLDGESVQLTGGDLSTFALVFDMNRVFEGFVVRLLLRHQRLLLPPPLRWAELLPRAQGATLPLAQAAGQPVFTLRPDLLVRQGECFPLLVDVKYRLLDEESRSLGVAADDFYQMLAYARRYRCPRVLLLYPQTAGQPWPLQRTFQVQGEEDLRITAATVDLRRNLTRPQGRRLLCRRLRALLGGEGLSDRQE